MPSSKSSSSKSTPAPAPAPAPKVSTPAPKVTVAPKAAPKVVNKSPTPIFMGSGGGGNTTIFGTPASPMLGGSTTLLGGAPTLNKGVQAVQKALNTPLQAKKSITATATTKASTAPKTATTTTKAPVPTLSGGAPISVASVYADSVATPTTPPPTYGPPAGSTSYNNDNEGSTASPALGDSTATSLNSSTPTALSSMNAGTGGQNPSGPISPNVDDVNKKKTKFVTAKKKINKAAAAIMQAAPGTSPKDTILPDQQAAADKAIYDSYMVKPENQAAEKAQAYQDYQVNQNAAALRDANNKIYEIKEKSQTEKDALTEYNMSASYRDAAENAIDKKYASTLVHLSLASSILQGNYNDAKSYADLAFENKKADRDNEVASKVSQYEQNKHMLSPAQQKIIEANLFAFGGKMQKETADDSVLVEQKKELMDQIHAGFRVGPGTRAEQATAVMNAKDISQLPLGTPQGYKAVHKFKSGSAGSVSNFYTKDEVKTGSVRAGISDADFVKLPRDVQNYYANADADRIKALNEMFTGYKKGDIDYTEALGVIDDSAITPVVRQYFINALGPAPKPSNGNMFTRSISNISKNGLAPAFSNSSSEIWSNVWANITKK